MSQHPLWRSKIVLREYISNMESAMNNADLVIARAGATTIAELTYLGKPAVLIPFPHATENHQAANARQLERAGGCRVLEQCDLESGKTKFAGEILALLANREVLREMARCAVNFGKKEAAYSVFRIIMQHVFGNRKQTYLNGMHTDFRGKTR